MLKGTAGLRGLMFNCLDQTACSAMLWDSPWMPEFAARPLRLGSVALKLCQVFNSLTGGQTKKHHEQREQLLGEGSGSRGD